MRKIFIALTIIIAILAPATIYFISTSQKDDYFEFELSSSAMDPNYIDNSWCRVDNNIYTASNPKRGDVILFRSDEAVGKKTLWVKRIIGLPTEKFEIANGAVYINGSMLSEAYLSSDVKTIVYPNSILKENQEVTIPKNSYIVLGDNRMNSADSREHGFINRDKIIGKVILCTPKT